MSTKNAQVTIEDIFSQIKEPANAEIVLDDGEASLQSLPSEIVVIDEPEHLIDVEDSNPSDMRISIPSFPGIEGPVDDIIIEDESDTSDHEVDQKEKEKPKDKWDWSSYGPENFHVWIQERVDAVPTHTGYDTAGLERAIAYMQKLDKEISSAMRLDLDGKIPHELVEDIREKIEDSLVNLEDRLDKVKQSGRKKKKKVANFEVKDIVKTAGSTRISGIVVTVPLLISRLCRICINGKVSAGHDMEESYVKLAKKYKLDDREKAEFMQLLSDMGYPLRQDRGMLDEDVDKSSSDNFDWAANYNS